MSEESESSTSSSSWSGRLPSRRERVCVSDDAEGDVTGVRYEEAEEAGDADTSGCREKVVGDERGFVGDVGSGTEAAIEVETSRERVREAGVGVEREECGE
jgi:hypothetical protein